MGGSLEELGNFWIVGRGHFDIYGQPDDSFRVDAELLVDGDGYGIQRDAVSDSQGL